MKFAVIQCANGNFTIVSEWENKEGAIKAYHGLCQALWNDASVITGCVIIVDEYLNKVDDYKEFITHSAS